MKKQPIKLKGDILIPMLSLILSLLGALFVYSASSVIAKQTYGSSYHYLKKQLFGVVGGVILMVITANIDYHYYFGKTKWFYIAGVVLLALCFVPKISVKIYGAKRWINLGLFTIQPSEIAKFCYIFFIAEYFSKNLKKLTKFRGFILPLILGTVICLLIMLEPNMSICMCVIMVMVIMLFLAGIKTKHFVLMLLPVLLLVPVLIIIEPYRLKRLTAFLNPWENPKGEGYQLLQSLYGLGSGGFFGVGLFNSRQKYRFLPFSESDFILSVIGEETGFFGTALLFIGMGLLIFRGIKTALNSQDFFGYMLAMGITTMYAVQVIINALVVTGSIPPTGLPLPLISSGNTSILVFLAAFGVLYNISASGKADFKLKSPKKLKKNKNFLKNWQKPQIS